MDTLQQRLLLLLLGIEDRMNPPASIPLFLGSFADPVLWTSRRSTAHVVREWWVPDMSSHQCQPFRVLRMMKLDRQCCFPSERSLVVSSSTTTTTVFHTLVLLLVEGVYLTMDLDGIL